MSDGLAACTSPLLGGTVLELGPGRTPELTGAFVLAGAAQAIGVDVELQVPADFSDPARYAPLVEVLIEQGGTFLHAAGTTPDAVRQRFSELQRGPWPASFMKYDGKRLPVATGSIDLCVSKSVLEHVPPADVPGLLAELRRVLRPGGAMVHVVDLRDHLHIVGDEAVSGDWLDALRYRERLFRAMFSNRSTSINRLRAPQWRQLAESSGFQVLEWRDWQFQLAPEFDQAQLQPPWCDYDLDVLSVGMIAFAATPVGDARQS
jgi:SAM-dependent methyltransferase